MTCKAIPFFLLYIVLLGSCSRQNEAAEKPLPELTRREISRVNVQTLDDLTLQPVNEVKIPIDSLTPNPIIYPVYFDGGNDHFLAFFNRNTHALEIISLQSKKPVKKIPFPSEGPLAISRNNYPFIKGMDSIFLFTLNPAMILLVDSTGKQLDAHNFPGDPQKLNINMVQPFFVAGSKAIMGYLPYENSTKLKDSANFLIYDLKSRSIAKSLTGRPRSVSEFPLYGSHAVPRLSTGHKNTMINFFGVGQLIIQSDLVNNTINYYVLRSKYLPNEYPEPKHDGAVVENRDALKGHYFMMVYDPYRYFYYLMCLLEEEEFDNEGNANGPDDMQLSIIIADTLFRRRGEVLLPKHKYFRSMLVTRDGLLVSGANSKNRAYHEDTLAYTLFRPVALQSQL
jgi:hypothetical protein